MFFHNRVNSATQTVVTELLNSTKHKNGKGYLKFVVTFFSHNHKSLYSVV